MPCQVVTKASCPQHLVWVCGREGNDAAAPRELWGWGHVQQLPESRGAGGLFSTLTSTH